MLNDLCRRLGRQRPRASIRPVFESDDLDEAFTPEVQ